MAGTRLRIFVKKAFYLEAAAVTMGQYVMSTPIIPSCCASIVKDMQAATYQNSQVIGQLMSKKTAGNGKSKVRYAGYLLARHLQTK